MPKPKPSDILIPVAVLDRDLVLNGLPWVGPTVLSAVLENI